MGGWVDGWVVGGTNYTNVNLWGQTTLVYYRGTDNLSMYFRGGWTENLNKYFERGTDNFDIIWKGDGQPKYVL